VPKSDPKIISPPAFLCGAAVLFWGVTTGNLLVALPIAVLLEISRWVKTRWDFEEDAHVKAFQLSLLLMAVWVALSWIDDDGRRGSLNVIQWLPLIFFPIEFVQRYGKLDRMNLNAFFYFSRRRMNLDRKEGKEVHPIQVNTGYPYLLGALAAAGSSDIEVGYYWIVLCIFVVAVLFSVLRQRGLQWRSALMVLPLVLVLSWVMQWSMSSVYSWAKNQLKWGMIHADNSGYLLDQTSHLAEPGKVRLNPKIEWRVWSVDNPAYVRTAAYNWYRNGRWSYNYKQAGDYKSIGDTYDSRAVYDGVSSSAGGAEYTHFYKDTVGRDPEAARAIRVRGTVKHNQASTVVPNLAGSYAIGDMLGEDIYAQVSPMGVLRVVDREMLVDYALLIGDEQRVLDGPPERDVDVEISDNDRLIIETLAESLGLGELDSDVEKVEAIVGYFQREFEYATNFDNGGYDGDCSKLEWFLNELKIGHCEYFATAATLLLRHEGIPARYCVGYVTQERGGSGCWNLRGTNAHAWTRAYINGSWCDVDATPASWRGVTQQEELDPVEWLRERINLLREDFFMWRQDPENREKILFRGGMLGGLLLLWIVYRLWRYRSVESVASGQSSTWDGERVVTPLHSLERVAKKHLPPRKAGEPLGQWLSQLGELDGLDRYLIEKAVAEHQALRFDGAGNKAELHAMVTQIKAQLRKL
jgi:hypothetical protein